MKVELQFPFESSDGGDRVSQNGAILGHSQQARLEDLLSFCCSDCFVCSQIFLWYTSILIPVQNICTDDTTLLSSASVALK